MWRVVQLLCHLPLATGQVRPAHGAGEQCVAGHDEPRLVAAATVGYEQADAVLRVPGGVQHVDDDVAGLQVLAIGQRGEGECHLSEVAFMLAVFSALAARQGSSAGTVVGVHVGVDDVGERRAGVGCVGDERVFVASDDINGHGLAEPRAAEEVGQGGAFGRALTEEHRGSPASSRLDRQAPGAPLGHAVGEMQRLVAELAQQVDGIASHQAERPAAVGDHGDILGQFGQASLQLVHR